MKFLIEQATDDLNNVFDPGYWMGLVKGLFIALFHVIKGYYLLIPTWVKVVGIILFFLFALLILILVIKYKDHWRYVD